MNLTVPEARQIANYIEGDVFHEVAGITVMDLRRQVSRKLPKKKANAYKKRQDRKFLQGRTYKDYKEYLAENPVSGHARKSHLLTI